MAGLWSTASAQSYLDDVDFDNTDAIVNSRSLSARILGGGDAEIGDYPSVVALVSTGFSSSDQRLFCGGTLVDERWVMTAAHCVLDNFQQPLDPASIRVVAGFSDLSLSTPADEVQVVQVVVHPDFNLNQELPPNDIALVELAASTAATVTPLFTGNSDLFTGSFGAIAGWGAIEFDDPFRPVYPTILQDASVPLVSHEDCNSPESYDGILAESHLCAGFVEGEIDACAGDSGGPLYIRDSGQQMQAGIVSFGVGCGLPLFYGIYTDVSFFIPWLSEFIPVPEQSADLILSRQESSENPSVSGGDSSAAGESFLSADSGGGKMGYLFLLLLLSIASLRAGDRMRAHFGLKSFGLKSFSDY